jgi:phosphatidylglycerol---prolipoprotein diacylglyceryl transferase
MHPVLFKFHLPHFLSGIYPGTITLYSYGFMIALGIVTSYLYTLYQAKRQLGIHSDKITDLAVLIMVAAYIGGKIFFFFEEPYFYFGHPEHILENLKSGFVFYGSLIFAIPAMIWFFHKNRLPALKMFDIFAFTACIVHAFGRTGCFLAGCCHGKPTYGIFGVIFTNPACAAYPLNVPLHPTQLYDVFLLLCIIGILTWIKARKKFDGQLFLIYIIIYAIGRSIIEIFRGDEERGFIIKNVLSYAQLISVILISCAVVFYFYLKRKNQSKNIHENPNLNEAGSPG